jgi:hypothetical protein
MRIAAVTLVVVAAACGARTLPQDPTTSALYRDLERQVTVAGTAGWNIDRLELEGLLSDALGSVCRVDPLARRSLATWLDEQIAANGGPVEQAYAERGRRLGNVKLLLRLHRVKMLLAHAEQAAPQDCPFWVEIEEPFRGRQISDGRWQLTLGGGGKGMLVTEGDRTDFSAGGAGRLLVGRVFDARSALYAGLELGATAAFPKDDLGNRGALVLGLDMVAPLVYRHTLTNAYWELEAGWLGRTTEEDLERIDQGAHVGFSVGGRALRTRFFFPGAALGISWERTFTAPDGADVTTIKVGARVMFDIDF